MATTIDVVSLQPSNDKDVLMDTEKKDDDASSNANSSENNENGKKNRKRGRPAGAKDLKRRKTPVRRKKEITPEAAAIETPKEVVAEVQTPNAAIPAAIPPKAATLHAATPAVSHLQSLFLKHLESKAADQAFWDEEVSKKVCWRVR